MKIKLLCYVSLLILFVCQQKVNCQQSTKTTLIHESIRIETDSIFNKLVAIRQHLHQNPELAGKEINTQKIIQQYLIDLGLEVKTDIYGYGLVGILKGAKKGKAITWRAEMDALSNDFLDDVPFKSNTKGIQHGCGHDIHMAIALGIAEVLSKNKNSLKGTVYFIFQPEEETFIGAKSMINNGLFSTIHPSEIYGLHVTALPVGQIMVKANEIFAYQKRIRITLKNELTQEQIKALTAKIHHSVTRVLAGNKPWEIQNVIDPTLGLANRNTIFADYSIIDDNFVSKIQQETLILEADLYETNAANLKNIIPTIQQTIESSNYKDQLLSIAFIQENPTVINDKKLTDIAIKTLDTIYGKGFVVNSYGQVPYFNDDFAYFQQNIRGVYFLLGGSNFQKGMIAMNHAPNFKVDETCIKTAVRSFSSLIFERLNAKNEH